MSKQLLSAKRTAHERVGIHTWHPYYGGFSEMFVKQTLSYLDTTKEDLILDPWGGSGTTALVASRLGFTSISIEINPVMAAFAAAKSPFVLQNQKLLRKFISSLPDRLHPNQIPAQHSTPMINDDILSFFSEYFHVANSVGPRVSSVNASAQSTFLTPVSTEPLMYPLVAFIRAIGFRTVRQNANVSGTSNPTWISQSSLRAKKKSPKELLSEITLMGSQMLEELSASYKNSTPTNAIHINGDCKKLPLANSSITRIVTSPPYLTRIDYAVSTAPELIAMGGESLLSQLRQETMGTTTITSALKAQNLGWGAACNKFLNTVANHESKSAKSYYWKNFIQYFSEVEASLKEMSRVTRKGGRGIVVVQNSYFKNVECKLSQIYVEIAETFGFKAQIVFRDLVGRGMASVNSRSRAYGNQKVYFEDFVLLVKY